MCTLPVEGIYCSAPFLWKSFPAPSSEYFLLKPKNLVQRRTSASEHYCSPTPTCPTASRNCSQACVTLEWGCTAHQQSASLKSASLPKSYPLTLSPWDLPTCDTHKHLPALWKASAHPCRTYPPPLHKALFLHSYYCNSTIYFNCERNCEQHRIVVSMCAVAK